MGFNYDNAANTAVNQISDKGRNVDILYKTAGVLDIDNDAITGGSTNTVTLKAISREYTQREIDGTIIMRGDREFIIAAKGATRPNLNDLLVDGSEQYTIKNVIEIKPGDTALLFKLQGRK